MNSGELILGTEQDGSFSYDELPEFLGEILSGRHDQWINHIVQMAKEQCIHHKALLMLFRKGNYNTEAIQAIVDNCIPLPGVNYPGRLTEEIHDNAIRWLSILRSTLDRQHLLEPHSNDAAKKNLSPRTVNAHGQGSAEPR